MRFLKRLFGLLGANAAAERTARRSEMGVSVEDLTNAILQLCVGNSETLSHDLERIRQGLLQGVDEHIALGELFMLRVSLAAYACQAFFGAAVQGQIRKAFGSGLHKILLGSGNERVKSQPNTIIDEINKRCNLYLQAIHTPHQLGAPWNVGMVFAELCGRELDLRVAIVGSVEFGGAMKSISEFLTECKHMEGGDVINLPEK